MTSKLIISSAFGNGCNAGLARIGQATSSSIKKAITIAARYAPRFL
jgi:hypothetical protein